MRCAACVQRGAAPEKQFLRRQLAVETNPHNLGKGKLLCKTLEKGTSSSLFHPCDGKVSEKMVLRSRVHKAEMQMALGAEVVWWKP